PVRVNRQIAIACMAPTAPGVERHSDTADHSFRADLWPWMPFLLPAHQIRRDAEFFAVGVLARFGKVEILPEKLHWIHVQLGREIVQRAHGEHSRLGMVGSPPCARRTNIVADRGMFLPLIRNTEN